MFSVEGQLGCQKTCSKGRRCPAGWNGLLWQGHKLARRQADGLC